MTDIFISFKNTYNDAPTFDAEIAQRIYDKLTSMKFNVFMMNETLQSMGAANYKKSIDQALDEARCIVIIGSRKEFFESQWIRYEWDTYLSEVLAGRKEDNIFTVRLGDVEIGDLPISLRKYQSFTPEKGDLLYAFVGQALKPSVEKDIVIDYGVYPAVFFYSEEDKQYTAAVFDLEIYCEGNTIEDAFKETSIIITRWFETAHYYNIKRPEATSYMQMKEMYPDNEILLVSAIVTKSMVDNIKGVEVDDGNNAETDS